MGRCDSWEEPAVDTSGAVIRSPFAPALAGDPSGDLWLVSAKIVPVRDGEEPVLHVSRFTGIGAPGRWTVPVPVGLPDGVEVERGGVTCHEHPTVLEPPVMEGPTASWFRGRLHIAARVADYYLTEMSTPDAGTLLYVSSATPLANDSWSQIVPQHPYADAFAGARLSAMPDGALYLWQTRQPSGGARPLYVRAKFSE